MLKIPDKYLWDGKENLSDDFLIRRMIEYASFPELIKIPARQVYDFLSRNGFDRLRCDDVRKKYLQYIMPFIKNTDDWHEATLQMIRQ
jgi:hypothetical protein